MVVDGFVWEREELKNILGNNLQNGGFLKLTNMITTY
jgi:hypothetical protein